MAVVAIEGFDAYNGTGVSPGMQARWLASGTSFVMVAGRFGGQAFQNSGGAVGGAMRLTFAANASIAFGLGLKATSYTGSVAGTVRPNITLLGNNGADWQIGIGINFNGALEVYRLTSATAGTLLGTTASGIITLGTWNYLEAEITISDTIGVINLYINGVSVLALSALDTRNTFATVDTIGLGILSATSTSNVAAYDDLYITDSAAKLGECRVETLYPTGDVTGATDWTISTGATHWGVVDEAQANAADFITASAVGNTDRFTTGAMSSTPSNVFAVQTNAFAEKTDATARSIALQVKSGATTSDGANFALAVSITKSNRLLLVDPATGAAWTAAAVNALEHGVKVTV